jgi:hypothetical protein
MRSIWKEEVSPSEPLWRYFKVSRLIETIKSGTLHFASARQFEDRFEGAVAVQPHDWPEDPRYADANMFEGPFEELRRLTKISCWHRADYESNAMWKLYADESKGVAIRTTVERLGASLKPFRLKPEYGEEVPYWGNVRYEDLFTKRLRASMEERFFYKHRAFEWEREFRVAISLRMAEEFAVVVPEQGIDVPFVPATLIESIHVGPFMEPAHRDELLQMCQAAGITIKPTVSTLLGKPRYM